MESVLKKTRASFWRKLEFMGKYTEGIERKTGKKGGSRNPERKVNRVTTH